MATQKVTFSNKTGETLSARLDVPADNHPVAYALFAHCFTCNKNLKAVNSISRCLMQKGFAVLRFDFTGLGESEGDFADTNFSSNVDDLLSAARFLEEKYEAPNLMVGHSLGGAAVLMAAGMLKSIRAVATIGAPANPEHLTQLFQDSVETINNQGKASVKLAGRTFTIKKQFIDDLEETHMQRVIEELKKPVLIMHSPQDNTVGINNAADIYTAAVHPKSFISLDGADHLLSNVADAQYVGETIATWANRYLEIPSPENQKHLVTDKQAVARVTEGFTTEIVAGNHSFMADEPTKIGGKDLGPSPYELLMGSLGACTAMTIRMYADRKKWPLEEVKVHLQHQKDYLQDCENHDNKQSLIDIVEREIELEGNLDQKQRTRLLEIANKCPVHKTLESKVKVITKEVNKTPD
jgi:uncharacterized OsmC-like protein/alpha/beta superfamily hydrolase